MTTCHQTKGAISRRNALILTAGSLAAAALPTAASGAEIETHGISAFGDLKYPADFKQLDYVDVNAPKGGLFSQVGPSRQYNQNFLTFNSLNSYILKGDAAQGMQLGIIYIGNPPVPPFLQRLADATNGTFQLADMRQTDQLQIAIQHALPPPDETPKTGGGAISL